MQKAIAAGADFLLSRDPAVADYPTPYGGKPSESWFRFGYPLGYVTDVLQNLEALARWAMAAILAWAVRWICFSRSGTITGAG